MAFIVCSADLPSGVQAEDYELSGRTMGPIRYRVVVRGITGEQSEQAIADDVQKTLDRVNQLMSTYIADSDVSRFNKAARETWVEVSAETVAVIKRAIEISDQSGGAFDITVGPAVDLWNFGPNKKKFALPNDEEIENVRKWIGYQNIEFRESPPSLRKSIDELRIDLSAIAKGYAVDQVCKTLDGYDVVNYMVEVGGEVRTKGEGPKNGTWRIGIEDPSTAEKIAGIAAIRDGSVATSGDYRNFEIVDGKRYSHTIDPRTARPVTNNMAIASVQAPDCMTADAMATTMMVLGREKGAELCEQLGYGLYTIERIDDGFSKFVSDSYTLANSTTVEPESIDTDIEAKPNARSIWPTFIGALVIFGLAIIAMAVGSIFANKPVKGSCGGIATSNGDESCSVCSSPVTDCIDRPDSKS